MLKDEKTVLRKILKEVSYWRAENAELAKRIQLCDSLKQHQKFELEETHLQKRNRSFHKHSLRAIMERTSLVEKLKDSRNELLNLQTQLELLKLKTYPTLRHNYTSSQEWQHSEKFIDVIRRILRIYVYVILSFYYGYSLQLLRFYPKASHLKNKSIIHVGWEKLDPCMKYKICFYLTKVVKTRKKKVKRKNPEGLLCSAVRYRASST